MKTEVIYKGSKFYYDQIPQLDNAGSEIGFYVNGKDESGNDVIIRWAYCEPEWHKHLSTFLESFYTDDLSDFADWDNPIEVSEQ